MIDSLESLLHRLDATEAKYLDLLSSYQELIHSYEVLKVRYEEAMTPIQPAWKPKYPYDNS